MPISKLKKIISMLPSIIRLFNLLNKAVIKFRKKMEQYQKISSYLDPDFDSQPIKISSYTF